MNLFKEREPSVESIITSLSRVSSKFTFISDINRVYQYSDEPKFYHYIARLAKSKSSQGGHPRSRDAAGGGSFFSQEEAYVKCIGEAIERYASSTYNESRFIRDSFANLDVKSAMNPSAAKVFNKTQLKNDHYAMFRYTNNTQFLWTKGKRLCQKSQQRTLIPAQLVYFNYKLSRNEKYIRLPISTGTAGGGSLSAAILRGGYEVLERDAFMISYLNKLPGQKIDLNLIKDESIRKIVEIVNRYGLEIHVLDITTDLEIPCFVSLLVNKSGFGSAVTVGLKCHQNPIKAIIDSIEEALHSRSWMRTVYEDSYNVYRKTNPSKIVLTEERGMYWYKRSRLKYLNFWLSQKPTPLKKYKFKKYSHSGFLLKELVKKIKSKKMDIYYVDITPGCLKGVSYKVAKTIIPGLLPFSMDEKYKYLGNPRLSPYTRKLRDEKDLIRGINQIPHPFL